MRLYRQIAEALTTDEPTFPEVNPVPPNPAEEEAEEPKSTPLLPGMHEKIGRAHV